MDIAIFRGYDPANCRWVQIDPRYNVEISPYVGFGNNPLVLVDAAGDTTRVYNTEGELLFTINDDRENQEHFVDFDESVVSDLRSLSEQDGTMDLAAGIVRSLSVYYVGANTRNDLAALSARGDSDQAEAYGIAYVGEGSKELRIGDESGRAKIVDNFGTVGDKCWNCRNAMGVSLTSAVASLAANSYIGSVTDVHTHGLYSALALAGGDSKTAKSNYNAAYLGNPSDSDQIGTPVTDLTGFSKTSVIATPLGYTIYSTGKRHYSYLNLGHIYSYKGNLIYNINDTVK